MQIGKYTLLTLITIFLSATLNFIQYSLYFDGEYFSLGGVFSFAAIAICFIPLIYALICNIKNKNSYLVLKSHENNNVFNAIATVFTGYVGYNLLIDYLNNPGGNTASGFSVELPLLIMVEFLFLYFLLYSIFGFMNKLFILENSKFIELIPVLVGIVLMLYGFIHYTMSILISENLYIILTVCSLSLSLLARSKVVTGFDEQKNSLNKFFLYSGLSISLSMSYSLSYIVASFFSGHEINLMSVSIQLIVLLLTSFMLMFMFNSEIISVEKEDTQVKIGKRYKK